MGWSKVPNDHPAADEIGKLGRPGRFKATIKGGLFESNQMDITFARVR